MSSLSIMSSDADVHVAIREVLSTKPLGHNMRWELEVQRRRLSAYEKDMRVAKEAYDAFNKTVTLSGEEVVAHKKALKEAQSKYELERNCWICAVGHVADMLCSAKLFDEMEADSRREAEAEGADLDNIYYGDLHTFRYLIEAAPGTPEEVRNKALQEAERQFRDDYYDVYDDCSSFYRGSLARGRSSAIHNGLARVQATYNKAVAEIEEAYYKSRLSPA